MIPRRPWIVEIDGEKKTFCNEQREELYRDYWLTDGMTGAVGSC